MANVDKAFGLRPLGNLSGTGSQKQLLERAALQQVFQRTSWIHQALLLLQHLTLRSLVFGTCLTTQSVLTRWL
jgi:hypothetical protein